MKLEKSKLIFYIDPITGRSISFKVNRECVTIHMEGTNGIIPVIHKYVDASGSKRIIRKNIVYLDGNMQVRGVEKFVSLDECVIPGAIVNSRKFKALARKNFKILRVNKKGILSKVKLPKGLLYEEEKNAIIVGASRDAKFWRFRQRQSKDFIKDSFRTVPIGNIGKKTYNGEKFRHKGIKVVIGILKGTKGKGPKGGSTWKIQTFLVPKTSKFKKLFKR